MCIRDSKKVDITLFSDLTSIKNTYIIKKRTNIYWAGYGTCLLYTSDAADDLLCVDLGGRRIIKKQMLITPTNIYIIIRI